MNKNLQSFKFSVNSWLQITVWAENRAAALAKAYRFGVADLKAIK